MKFKCWKDGNESILFDIGNIKIISLRWTPASGPLRGTAGRYFFEWDFCYMLNNNLNAHGGFTPAAVAPPKRDNPEQEIRHLV